ncbi:hypothetical protein Q8W71_09405 [Methylobacterium sp. NEAU 140]|uniref:hypothetical protein n=1 Tax=Methylobacterium sp. NEAU 140 TaxID=3064945 RepID=UPI002734D480|nr:hypothetical protein [Methylobacterium sp. NEAU 140]MDP4022837.1 hypothetical protein [Methylobacterium sp. NEAU 140]
MLNKVAFAAMCTACVMAVIPAQAAPKEQAAQKEMPQGQRDEMSMKDTRHQVTAQEKENKEADKNVDSLIKNRR